MLIFKSVSKLLCKPHLLKIHKAWDKCSACMVIWYLKTGDFKNWQKYIQDLWLKKIQNLKNSLTRLFSDYMGHGTTKEFWKNSHFENVTAGFLLRCQKLLRYFTPERVHFQAWKKNTLTTNNFIAFDPIRI